MTIPCCRALRTLAMIPTSGRIESCCLVWSFAWTASVNVRQMVVYNTYKELVFLVGERHTYDTFQTVCVLSGDRV